MFFVDNVQKLQENTGRYRFWKIRRSDAFHMLAQENDHILKDTSLQSTKDNQAIEKKKGNKVCDKESDTRVMYT